MQRSQQFELMDSPDADPAVLRGALRELVLINRALGGYDPSIEGVERLFRLLEFPSDPITILDVGCGSGDTLRRIAGWARQRGVPLRAVGIELSNASVEQARADCAGFPEIAIERRDLFDLDPARRRFDIVHAAMMLHHMPDDAGIRRALRAMAVLARRGVVVNDLHRHRFAHAGIAALTQLLSRNSMIRHDAPLSVARGFTRRELLAHACAAGLTRCIVSWRWAFRWLLMAPTQAS